MNWRLSATLAAGLLVTTACGAGAAGHVASTANDAGLAATSPASSGSPAAAPSASASSAPSSPAGSAAKPLAGKTVGIDPGHNGRNKDDPTYINHLIWNGRESETCDTTGTVTADGYTEARFNFNVATYLRADLRKDGARVVMTRKNNHGVGPCVNKRAWILNDAHANVAIDIHADGGPVSGRGFTVLEPVADGPNDKVIKSSVRFGRDVRAAILKYTSMPESDYYGHDGIIFRNDLAGLNLTRVPKILIESGNMQNPTDARLLQKTWFQKRLAKAYTAAIVVFLTKR
jgi:N-acetylmuramoyl-L-alanine amidase